MKYIKKRVKRLGLPFLLTAFLAAVFCVVMFSSYTFLHADDNQTPVSEQSIESEHGKVSAAVPISGQITNLVIFICFYDEDTDLIRNAVNDELIGYYTGESNSLKDYYSAISYGAIKIDTVFPKNDAEYFVYRAPEPRSHYAAIKNGNSSRMKEESTLLNGAIAAADRYFDYNGINLDVNSDGFADSVSFLVSGTYDSASTKDWGGLLWPHSANLTDYTKSSKGKPAYLNGLKIGEFSFNFMQSVDTGLICHETGHVLSMPDLYHYYYSKDYIPVGTWDIMHAQTEIPQYPTVYIRNKYLKVIGDNQIVNLKSNGVYSLKPVSSASGEDVLAYRLQINENESIWMEYRSNTAGLYDSKLPRSGLIVYRVNSSVSGNEKGQHNNFYFPDEVFVYRPSVDKSYEGTRNGENKNLSYAAMSPDNPHFKSLGGTNYGNNYNKYAIYLTNGQNTGVKIEVVSMEDDEITFSVDTNGYGPTEVTGIYVEGNPEINYGETPLITLKIKLKGYTDYFIADPSEYKVVYDPELIGTQTAKVLYTDEDGNEIGCLFTLKVNDKIEVDGAAVEKLPNKTEYSVDDDIDLSGLVIKVRYVSGAVVEVEYFLNNSSLWLIEGVTTAVSGVYGARITYVPFGANVFVEFSVRTELVSIRASERDSTTIIDVDGSLVLNIEGVNADGTVRRLEAGEFTVNSFSRLNIDLYKPQEIFVRSVENPEFTCKKTIYVVKLAELTSIERKSSPKNVFRYGEALDLSDGTVTMHFSGDKSIDVPMENYFGAYYENFSATKQGNQVLKISVGSVEHTLNVIVLPPDSGILTCSKDTSVQADSGLVLLDKSMTVAQAAESFQSYLNIRFVYRDGDLSYKINVQTQKEMLLNSNVKIELYNSEGQIVSLIKVFVKGDANGDGKADANDIDGWADALFRGNGGNVFYLDMNGDNKYTLTDFTLLVERYCK